MKQCDHYFDCGYTIEPIVYCTKCDKEIDELGIPTSILRNHEVKNGKLVLKSPIVLKKPKRDRLFYTIINALTCSK